MTPATVITIELEDAGDDIAGTMRIGDAPSITFVGWLELVTQLERGRFGLLTADSPPSQGP